MTRKPIEQQVIAIIGAASGIGRETALEAARRGAKLLVSDFDDQGLRSLVEEIRHSGGEVESVNADVASFDQMKAAADAAVERFGRLDTWIHLAAVGLWSTFLDTTPDEFRRVIEVDLLGQVYGAKAALPHLIDQGGGLIHVSSIEAKRSFPYHTAYAAAKHGIDGYLEALRVELRHAGIPVSVTQILPASINTPLFNKGMSKIGVKPKGAPPFYHPSTVAKAILHAVEHPRRDIVVGGAGDMILLTQRLSPRALDAVLVKVGFALQRTNEPRSPAAPNGLFGPAEAYDRVEGDFGHETFRHSLFTWLDLHPTVKAATTVGAAIGLGGLIGRRAQGQRPTTTMSGHMKRD